MISSDCLFVKKENTFSGSWTLGDASVKVVNGRKTTVPYFTKLNEIGVCQWTQRLLRGIVTNGQEENFLYILHVLYSEPGRKKGYLMEDENVLLSLGTFYGCDRSWKMKRHVRLGQGCTHHHHHHPSLYSISVKPYSSL